MNDESTVFLLRLILAFIFVMATIFDGYWVQELSITIGMSSEAASAPQDVWHEYTR